MPPACQTSTQQGASGRRIWAERGQPATAIRDGVRRNLRFFSEQQGGARPSASRGLCSGYRITASYGRRRHSGPPRTKCGFTGRQLEDPRLLKRVSRVPRMRLTVAAIVCVCVAAKKNSSQSPRVPPTSVRVPARVGHRRGGCRVSSPVCVARYKARYLSGTCIFWEVGPRFCRGTPPTGPANAVPSRVPTTALPALPLTHP